MGVERSRDGSFKTANKRKRQELHVQRKKATDKSRRETRMGRRKEEGRDPELRRSRLEKNQPASIDKKRVWDDVDDDSLGAVVDLAQLKRRRIEQEEAEALRLAEAEEEDEEEEDDVDSMLGSDEEEDEEREAERMERIRAKRAQRAPSLAPSTTSTNLDLTPSSLALRFPTLFSDEPPAMPKLLITTTFNSTLHEAANILCGLFPNSEYVPRSKHRFGHKYSVREIAKFASNRGYTSLLVLREDLKKPAGLDIVHLPAGPTFHFSINNWIEGKKLPGHGKAQDFYPELLLNGFKTPLGLLTAKVFQSLFPPQPELQGRQVVALQNQRDYIFLRRYRIVFRDKRPTEKSAVDADGKEISGVEQVRVGMQTLGPNCTLKLRRVDKGIGRAGSEGDDAIQWEWKAKMEKKRTRFNL